MLAFLTVFVNLAIGILILSAGDQNTIACLFLFASMQIAGLFYAFILHSQRPRNVSYILFVFYCYGFIMPGMYQARTAQFFWPSHAISEDTANMASYIVFFSLLAFMVGYFTRKAKTLPAASIEPTRTLPTRRHDLPTLIVVLIAATFILLMLASFGPGIFFGTRQSISRSIAQAGLDSTTRGLTRTLSQALGISALAIAGYMRFRSPSPSRMIKFSFIIALAGNFIANYPAAVPRYWLIASAFVMLFTIFFRFSSNWRRWIYFSTPLFLFLIFPTLGQFNRRGDEVNWAFHFKSPTEFMSHGDLDGFQSMMNVVNLVEVQGVSWGGQMLSVFLFFVPRSFWPGKYRSVGSDAAAQAGYDFTTISMPLPGELYANGGMIGAVIGLFFFGRLIRRLDYTFGQESSGSRSHATAIYSILVASFMPILFRGSLLGSFAGFASAIALVYLWRFISMASGRN